MSEQSCSQGQCPAERMVTEFTVLAAQMATNSKKLDDLTNVVDEMKELKAGFSLMTKIAGGIGASIPALYGIYSFFKEHCK